MTGPKKKVLVIEDESHLREGLRLNLSLANYDVDVAENGREGLLKWRSFTPDLIILDIMMPELDGHQVLKEVRKEDPQVPIMILSAKNESTDKVWALKNGVDDYLGKPFDLEEFLLRSERLLERSGWNKKIAQELKLTEYQFGENRVSFTLNKAQTRNGEVELTVQELRVLEFFFLNEGRPITRDELLEAGWAYQKGVSTRTVDNFMVRFRKYFEVDPKNPTYFSSVRSVGYLFKK